ncbi:hypothetical protein RN001_014419, partial [Aquatica leii]
MWWMLCREETISRRHNVVKRPNVAVKRRSAVTFPEDPSISKRNKAILDYVLTQAVGNERPYLTIEVLCFKVCGLLDSGATHTIHGTPGLELMQQLGLNKTTGVTLANGKTCGSVGTMLVPVQLLGNTSHSLILGIDCWKQFAVVPDLRLGFCYWKEWAYFEQPFVFIVAQNILCLGVREKYKPEETFVFIMLMVLV